MKSRSAGDFYVEAVEKPCSHRPTNGCWCQSRSAIRRLMRLGLAGEVFNLFVSQKSSNTSLGIFCRAFSVLHVFRAHHSWL